MKIQTIGVTVLGKSKFKQIMSLILSLTMLFTLTAGLDFSAYAAATEITGGTSQNNAVSISFSKEYAVTNESGGTKWFKFTTKNSLDYWYNITIKGITASVSGRIFDKFSEEYAYAYAYSGNQNTSGGKLECNTTYYLKLDSDKGTIKFQLDCIYDEYGENDSSAKNIQINQSYQSTIASTAGRHNIDSGCSDDRKGDYKYGNDVDVVKFNSDKYAKIKLTLTNKDIDYYNSYFYGIKAIVYDKYGQYLLRLDVKPNQTGYSEFTVEKNTIYYIRFFSSSGKPGTYLFKLECAHAEFTSKTIKQATCCNEGIKQSKCTACDYVKNESVGVDRNNHKKNWIVDDNLRYRCEYCRDEFAWIDFYDLQGYDNYCTYIAYTSYYNSFITGTNPPDRTLFSPNQSITRAMFITILYRMAGEPYKNANPYKSSPFTDIKNTNVYYYDAACWALDNDITTQITFKPYNNVSREQTASFLFRYAQKNNKLGSTAYKNTNLTKFYDYDNINSWAIEAMKWANYNGMITGTQQGFANPQGSTLRIHATKILYGFGKVCGIGNFE